MKKWWSKQAECGGQSGWEYSGQSGGNIQYTEKAKIIRFLLSLNCAAIREPQVPRS